MGILANNFRDVLGVTQTFGATVVTDSGYGSTRVQNFARTGAMRNITAGQGITSDLVGIPDGNRHPNSWVMPQKGGALASRNFIFGAGDMTASGTMGLNAIAALSGSGTLTGAGALIVSLVAALTGSGTISSAAADAFLNLAATLAGAGDLAGAANAIGHAAAALQGDGDLSSTATALGTLAASITVTGDLLTTANIGDAVWQAILSCGYTAEEAMQILTAVAAGKSTITDLGGGLATVVFRDLPDSRNVVDADLTNSERTTVTLDP